MILGCCGPGKQEAAGIISEIPGGVPQGIPEGHYKKGNTALRAIHARKSAMRVPDVNGCQGSPQAAGGELVKRNP